MPQPMRTTRTLGARAITKIPPEPASRPRTIHGRRLPHRQEVRSLILPKNGFATIDNSPPTPATSDRLFGARSVPTSEFTLRVRVTSRGARNNRLVLRNANVYSTMKPGPTRTPAAAAPSAAPVPETSGAGTLRGRGGRTTVPATGGGGVSVMALSLRRNA